jgi:hypothetical protein
MELKDLFKGLLTALPVISVIISIIAAYISFHYFRKSKEHAETVLLNNYISEAAREFE